MNEVKRFWIWVVCTGILIMGNSIIEYTNFPWDLFGWCINAAIVGFLVGSL